MSECVIVPNSAAIGQSMIEISRFFEYQDCSRPPFWILKIQNLNGRQVNMRHRAIFRGNRSNRCRAMAIFLTFQDGGRRHLGFFKFQIFNGRLAEEGRTAWLC